MVARLWSLLASSQPALYVTYGRSLPALEREIYLVGQKYRLLPRTQKYLGWTCPVHSAGNARMFGQPLVCMHAHTPCLVWCTSHTHTRATSSTISTSSSPKNLFLRFYPRHRTEEFGCYVVVLLVWPDGGRYQWSLLTSDQR